MDMKFYKTTAWDQNTEVHPSNEPVLSECPYNYQTYARTTFQFLLRIWRSTKNHYKNENSIHPFNYLTNSMVLSPFSEAASRSATQEFQHFMEPDGSLPCT
jgi:hypothetical protein